MAKDNENKEKNIEGIFGFDGFIIKDFDEEIGIDGHITINFNLELKDHKRLPCPKCNSLNVYKHSLKKRELLDLSVMGKTSRLFIDLKSYRCQECKSVYQEDISQLADKGSNITNRLREAIARESTIRGFTSASEMYSVSTATAKESFNKWTEQLDKLREDIIEAPEILGLDESHLSSVMRGVFIDINKGRLIDITADRNADTIKNFITNMSGYKDIKAVTTDLYKVYRKVVYEVYGDNFVLIADKFHVIQNLIKKMSKSRAFIVKKAGGIRLGNNHNLMKMNYEDLNSKQKEELFNHFALVPELGTLYGLKESFRSLYKCKTKEEALEKYKVWYSQIPEKDPVEKTKDDSNDEKAGKKRKKHIDRFDPIRTFKNTVDEWEKEIFAWYDTPVTNAATEAINGLIKRINAAGRGYGFDILRKKALYGLTAKYLPTEKVFERNNNDKKITVTYNLVIPGYESVYINPLNVYGYRPYTADDLTPRIDDIIFAIENNLISFDEEYVENNKDNSKIYDLYVDEDDDDKVKIGLVKI